MMSYAFSTLSLQRLYTCDGRLINLLHSALNTGLMDIAVLEGRRSKALQDKAYSAGASKLQWPNSKHNTLDPGGLSLAVDAAPFINGRVSYDQRHCTGLAYIILTCAVKMGLRIRWGGNWDRDGEPITDQTFQDLVHFELMEDG